MIDTIIIDLDGPILDGRKRHFQCYERILKENGFTPIEAGRYWQSKRERLDRRRLLAMSGADAIYDLFLQAWLEYIEQPDYLALDRLWPGVLDQLEAWHVEGKRLILATLRQDPVALSEQLANLTLDTIFNDVVICNPERAGFGKATEVRNILHNTAGKSCLWIGDTEVDIKAARAIHCQIWAVSCGLRTHDYLASLNPDFLSEKISCVDFKKLNGIEEK